jgi:hypothetical protein
MDGRGGVATPLGRFLSWTGLTTMSADRAELSRTRKANPNEVMDGTRCRIAGRCKTDAEKRSYMLNYLVDEFGSCALPRKMAAMRTEQE